ncbi:MAG: retropepsin-like aspartic protease [Alphaproteobacteria bacterium]
MANPARGVYFLGGSLTAFLVGAGPVIGPAQAATTPAAASCRAVSDRPVALEIVRGLPLVTVLADGVPLKLLLDTGAERTVLTDLAAKRTGGKAPQIQFRRSLDGVAASLPSREIEFESLSIGGVEIPWRRARVAKIALPPSLSMVDGVLGADVLGRFDIDLDLPKQRMSLYEQGACMPDWAGRQAEIKIGRSALSGHLFFPVRLDGREITATIDTGAQRTTLSAAAARAMGITDAVLARDPPIYTRGIGGGRLASRLHRFDSLAVGPVRLSHPEIVVTSLRLRGIDLILGMDFLRSRRLFLSHAGFRMFLANQAGGAASESRSAH